MAFDGIQDLKQSRDKNSNRQRRALENKTKKHIPEAEANLLRELSDRKSRKEQT